MQKLIETLGSFGIEIPEDKQADVKKALSEHYKNAGEVAKTLAKVETERDAWKERAETAENTLKSFEGIDPESIKGELATWKQKAADAEKEYNDKIYDRDFADALKAALEDVKFSSTSAKKAVMADIKDAGLKLKDGKILGLNDLLDQMKEDDASAFVDDDQQTAMQNQARFTTGITHNNKPGKMTKADIMNIKDAGERQAAIASNMSLFE
nr:MAG TPA: minor structural protein [Bacteriophage sp.]